MRIAVDFHVAADRPQGSLSFLSGLYGAISRARPDLDLIAVREGLGPSSWIPTGMRQLEFRGGGRVRRLLLGGAEASKALRPDWFHFQYVTPFRVRSKIVLTVHDILPITHPHLFPLGNRTAYRALVTHSVRHAALLTTVSNYTKEAMVEHLHIDREQILVVPNGVEHGTFHPLIEGHTSESLRFLFVGRIERRKNLHLLIEALAQLRDAHDIPAQLDVVGNIEDGWEYAQAALLRTGMSPHVTFHGVVPTSHLAALYQHATALIFPSEAEGFGIPIIEAMASGCPVVATNSTAMPEVVGDAGLLVHPNSSRSLAEAMRTLATEPRLHRSLADRGIARASSYTWGSAAQVFLQGLSRASRLAGSPGRLPVVDP